MIEIYKNLFNLILFYLVKYEFGLF
jgi:hypothetical protein